MITTPLLEQGFALNLPQGGKPDTKILKDNIRIVEIDARGNFLLAAIRASIT